MRDSYKIGLIGAGNLAWHLAPALENIGHRISLVYNRSRKNAYEIIERLYHAEYKKNLDFSEDQVDLVIIAVSDQIISRIAAEIVLPDNCQLIHTSGCQPLHILEPSAASHAGILYPLQTFTKGVKIDFRDIPVFLESSSQEGLKQLIQLTHGLSKNILETNSQHRSVLHLSAVISTNFSNHLFTLAKRLLDQQDIDFNLLQPIAQTMIMKIFTIGPESGQTGPAIRNDFDTMDHHMELLDHEEDLMELYALMSKQIIKSAKSRDKG
ncbi:MAG: DUF2520 domain-containing protein [Cyclobacteriaceae bacterium]|nr:DUF2520 domain-containing protein [Cyclobacteriaceae bacterium]